MTRGANVIHFTSDEEGRLEEAKRTDDTGTDVFGTATFTYDGRSFLREVVEAGTGATAEPLYGSDGVIHALTRQDSAVGPEETAHIFYFAGRPVAQVVSGATADEWWYFITDHLGTPTVATDAAGEERWVGPLEPFGQDPAAGMASGALGSGVVLRSPGQWKDESWANATMGAEVYYNVHRWYAPGLGRYTRTDPLGAEGDSHPYLYAAANPLLLVDALGLKGRVGICCKSLADPLSAFQHCYIRRIDDVSGEVTTIGMHTSQNVGNYIAASFLFTVSEIEVNHPFDFRRNPGTCTLRPDPCDEVAECVLQASATYPSPAYYSLTGPNSNTFAGNVARQCNLETPSIAGTWQTPGWHGAPPARFGGRR